MLLAPSTHPDSDNNAIPSLLSVSKHAPDSRTLSLLGATLAATGVMLRQAQHDDAGDAWCYLADAWGLLEPGVRRCGEPWLTMSCFDRLSMTIWGGRGVT
ncbi:MAG: hypothetical protein AMXMBFR61_12720 [Fimbriimonadales bacterium]